MGEDGRVEWRRQLHGADDRLDKGGCGLEAREADRELARRRAGRVAILVVVVTEG
jgi:hypothetical protein